MVNGTISSLHNKDGEVAFPITVAKAIYMDDGNTTLEAEVKKIANQFKNIAIMINTKEELVYYFNNCNHNDHFIINSAITVDGVKMEDKNNITVEFRETVTQQPTIDDTCSMEHAVSYQPTFHFVNCENLKIINPLINPVHEGICILDCFGIISGGVVDGQGRSKFSGIIVTTKKQFKIDNVTVKNCGTQPSHDGVNLVTAYGFGHGIHTSVASNVTIENCYSYGNGANGIFSFACSDIVIKNNISKNNGMSGIQISFGTLDDRNYIVDGNCCENNIADGLDINNTTSFGILKINASIINNKYKNNGWYNGLPTQDGSGIVTLANVADIIVQGNISKDSNRTGVFVLNCNNIKIDNNIIDKTQASDGQCIYVHDSSEVNITNNTCNGDDKICLDFRGNVSNIIVENNNFKSTGLCLSFPNETIYNNVTFSNNTIVSGSSINVKFNMINNHITTINDGCLFAHTSDLIFMNNTVISSACTIKILSSHRLIIKNNQLKTRYTCVYASGISSNNIFENNKIMSDEVHGIYIAEAGVTETYLIKNIISGNSASNSYRFEPGNCGSVYLDKNIILSGYDERGNGVIHESNWS